MTQSQTSGWKSLEPLAGLRKILERRGNGILEDSETLEALLRDYCPWHRSEVNLLLNALKEGVAQTILDEPKATVREALLGRLRSQLQGHQGMSESSAQWAAETWFGALRGIDGASADPQEPKKPEKNEEKAEKVEQKKEAEKKEQRAVQIERPKEDLPKDAVQQGRGSPAEKEPPTADLPAEIVAEVRKGLMTGTNQRDACKLLVKTGVPEKKAEELVFQWWSELPPARRRQTRIKDGAIMAAGVIMLLGVIWVAVLILRWLFGFAGDIFSGLAEFFAISEILPRLGAGDYWGALRIIAAVGGAVAFLSWIVNGIFGSEK